MSPNQIGDQYHEICPLLPSMLGKSVSAADSRSDICRSVVCCSSQQPFPKSSVYNEFSVMLDKTRVFFVIDQDLGHGEFVAGFISTAGVDCFGIVPQSVCL